MSSIFVWRLAVYALLAVCVLEFWWLRRSIRRERRIAAEAITRAFNEVRLAIGKALEAVEMVRHIISEPERRDASTSGVGELPKAPQSIN